MLELSKKKEERKKYIEKLVFQFVMDKEFSFENWYSQDFETDICVESYEELEYLTPNQLEILMGDWVYANADSLTIAICKKLGYETKIKTNTDEEKLNEVYEVVKECLYDFISPYTPESLYERI